MGFWVVWTGALGTTLLGKQAIVEVELVIIANPDKRGREAAVWKWTADHGPWFCTVDQTRTHLQTDTKQDESE